MKIDEFVYEDDDIVSDTIITFINSLSTEEIKKVDKFMNLYINDSRFFDFIKKNFLINKISVDYLIRLLNDYDEDTLVDDYDQITSVNITRWI